MGVPEGPGWPGWGLGGREEGQDGGGEARLVGDGEEGQADGGGVRLVGREGQAGGGSGEEG